MAAVACFNSITREPGFLRPRCRFHRRSQGWLNLKVGRFDGILPVGTCGCRLLGDRKQLQAKQAENEQISGNGRHDSQIELQEVLGEDHGDEYFYGPSDAE